MVCGRAPSEEGEFAGQSAVRHEGPEEKQRQHKMGGKITAGARFVGKKMLNAVRATNTVRSLAQSSGSHCTTIP